MRGHIQSQTSLINPFTVEQRIGKDHPIRRIKTLADEALTRIDDTLDAMYSDRGAASIPPERLLKAQLLIALYSVRSDRQFCEQLDYNLLFRFFLDMDLSEPSFHATSFTKNREKLIEHEVAQRFFAEIIELARSRKLLSNEHFTVDGTLIEAWASMKSFRPKDEKKEDRDPPDDKGNPSVDFHGEKRRNDTHASTTDKDATLMRKSRGEGAKLAYLGHALMENRNGIVVEFAVHRGRDTTERQAALDQMRRHVPRGATVGADKGYDTHNFVSECMSLGVEPHVARAMRRFGGTQISDALAASEGYATSQRIRKRIEECFGWLKTVGGLRRTRFRGVERVQLQATLCASALNLLRIAKLSPV